MSETGLVARAEEHFAITYDGPAVEGGRMSVQELAPSLIALSRALQEAQQVIDPLGRQPALDITAVREGSFAVDLVLSGNGILEGALDFLTGREASAAVNLAELVAIVFGGFRLTRWLLRGISSTTDLEDGTVRITFADGQTLVIPQESLLIAGHRGFREAARDVVAPLRAEGLVEIRLERTSEPEPVTIAPADLPSFDLPAAESQELLDVTMETILRPVTIAFNDGNKWRVTDGDATYYATISDRSFVERVQRGERFAKGDIIRARVRSRQYRDSDGELHTEREIVEVLEHMRASQDVPLPFQAEGGSASDAAD